MAAVQPRLSSTELPTKAPYDLRLQMLILVSSNAAMWGARCVRTAMHRIADHRGSSRLSRQSCRPGSAHSHAALAQLARARL